MTVHDGRLPQESSAPVVDDETHELERKYRTWLEAHPEALDDVATAFVRQHLATGIFVKRTTGGEVRIPKEEFEIRQSDPHAPRCPREDLRRRQIGWSGRSRDGTRHGGGAILSCAIGCSAAARPSQQKGVSSRIESLFIGPHADVPIGRDLRAARSPRYFPGGAPIDPRPAPARARRPAERPRGSPVDPKTMSSTRI